MCSSSALLVVSLSTITSTIAVNMMCFVPLHNHQYATNCLVTSFVFNDLPARGNLALILQGYCLQGYVFTSSSTINQQMNLIISCSQLVYNGIVIQLFVMQLLALCYASYMLHCSTLKYIF